MSDYLWRIVCRMHGTGDLQRTSANGFCRFGDEPEAEAREHTEGDAEQRKICARGEDSAPDTIAIVRERAAVSGAEPTPDAANPLRRKSPEPSFCYPITSDPEAKESQRSTPLEETPPEHRSRRTAPSRDPSKNSPPRQTTIEPLVQERPRPGASGQIENKNAPVPSDRAQHNTRNEIPRAQSEDAMMPAQSVPVLVPARVQSIAYTPPSGKPTPTPSKKLIIGEMRVEVVSENATRKQEDGRSGSSRSRKREPERDAQVLSRSPLRFGLGQM